MRAVPKSVFFFAKILIYPILRLFFNSTYLTGRHFDASLAGYVWCIRAVWTRNILRLDRTYPFPVALGSRISNPRKISFHPDNLDNFQSPGIYLQNFSGHITLGHGCYLAPNVGIITANHDPRNPDVHLEAEDVVIGERCWIGMNSVILPGVILGPGTVVGSGSVVTRSFPEGDCIVAGAPARLIRKFESTIGLI
ncbi:DapH/DapD/GlmU-related protein [Azonexus sp.]|uniref:acyltransferase n=1 Tax=Azonexus sp. TaxID=1872668 RepID=UPI0035B48440